METLYTVNELANLWKFSAKTIRRLVSKEPDVIRLPGPGLLAGTAKRAHITLRIPESVANRIRETLTQPVTKPVLMMKPPRTIRRIPKARAA